MAVAAPGHHMNCNLGYDVVHEAGRCTVLGLGRVVSTCILLYGREGFWNHCSAWEMAARPEPSLFVVGLYLCGIQHHSCLYPVPVCDALASRACDPIHSTLHTATESPT